MDSMWDKKPQETQKTNAETPGLWFIYMVSAVFGSIVGAMIGYNLFGERASPTWLGAMAGLLVGIVLPLAISDIAADTLGRGRADKAGSWLVRVLLVLALGVYLYDRVQVEIAASKARLEPGKVAPK